MTDVRLGIFDASSNVTTDIVLKPTWDYETNRTLNKVTTETIEGRLANYVWSDYYSFKVPIEFLCTSDTSMINEWWEDGSNLRFTDASSDASRYFSVKITNLEQPFSMLMKPYNNQYRGVLILETI